MSFAGGGIPERIGKYEIRGRIGGGGQKTVLLGYDPNLKREAAIAILNRGEEVADEFARRFETEALVSAQLDHPNIVKIYEYDKSWPYLVMEYCEGGDLRRIVKSGQRRSIAENARFVRQIASALQHAHENDPPILHRDVKPGNILFRKGVPKVGDFGLAKVLGGSAGHSLSRGSMIGTAAYMSPEQITDPTRVDARSDIWGLGVVFFELLSWSRPFDRPGDNEHGVLLRVTTATPYEPRYEIPHPVMSVIRCALRKDPSERFPTMRDFIAALDAAVAELLDPDELIPPESALREEDRLVAALAQDLESGNEDRAAQVLRNLSDLLGADNSLVRYWRGMSRLRSTSGQTTGPKGAWFEDIAQLVAGLRFDKAREEIGRVLRRDPDNPFISDLLDLLKENEREVKTALTEAYASTAALRERSDLPGVVLAWQQVADRFPALDEAQVQLAIARREHKDWIQANDRTAALSRAKAFAESGELEAAVDALSDHLAAYPNDATVANERQTLQAELVRRRHSQRVAALLADADARHAADDLEGEIAALDALLQVEAGDKAARARRDGLRLAVAARRRQQAIDAAARRAAELEAGGDLAGAIVVHARLLAQYPDAESSNAERARLTARLAAREQEAAIARLDAIAGRLSAALEARRFASLPGEERRARQALERAAKGRSANDVAILDGLGQEVQAVHDQAEAALTADLGRRRRALLDVVASARGTLDTETVLSGAAASLDEALGRALAALARADAGADAITEIERTRAELAEGMERLRRERQVALAGARADADTALEAATRAVAKLEALATGDTALEAAATRMAGELTGLPAREGAASPAQLSDVADRARAIAARADAERLAAAAALAASFRKATLAARDVLSRGPDEALEGHLARASRLAVAAVLTDPAGASALRTAAQSLELEAAAVRTRRQERQSAAEKRWREVSARWIDALRVDVGVNTRAHAELAHAAGDAALAATQVEELESWSVLLEGLLQRYPLEAACIETEVAARRVEARSDPRQEALLARYRTAIAAGDVDQVRTIGSELKAQARGTEDPEPGVKTVPALDAAARRFNERVHSSALARYDRLRVELEGSQGRTPTAEYAAARAALLDPPRAWPRIAVLAAYIAVIIVGVAYGSRPMPEKTYPVRLVAPMATQAIEVDVAAAGIESLRVGSEGVEIQLKAGQYEVQAGSRSIQLQVPDQPEVLLMDAPAERPEKAWLDALQNAEP